MNTQESPPSINDRVLVNQVAERDQSALSEIYHRYGHLVYSLALRILSNHELAEEITQDVFLHIWNNPSTWNPAKGRFSSWLLTVTRYKAIDRIRREARRPHHQTDMQDETRLHLEQAGQPDTPHLEDGRLINGLLAQLPVEQAQVIELAFFYGMTHAAMAQHLNLPLGTVKTRLRLGLQKLKSLWEAATDSDSP